METTTHDEQISEELTGRIAAEEFGPEKSAEAGSRLLAFLLLAVLSVLDLIAIRLSYWTLGDLPSGLYFLGTLLMLPLFFGAIRFPRAASLVGLVLTLCLAPYPFWLANQWLQGTREAASLAVEAYEYRVERGHFPEEMPARITDGGTEVRYRVHPDGSSMAIFFSMSYGTSHSLSTPSGVWFWEAD